MGDASSSSSGPAKVVLPPPVPTARERRNRKRVASGVEQEDDLPQPEAGGFDRVFEVEEGGRRKVVDVQSIPAQDFQRRRFTTTIEDVVDEEPEPPWRGDVEQVGLPADMLDGDGEMLNLDGTDPDEGPTQTVRPGRSFYMTSDDPMSRFRMLENEVIQASFFLDTLPENSCCVSCESKRTKLESVLQQLPEEMRTSVRNVLSPPTAPNAEDHSLYRCSTCGIFAECKTCCLERHQHSPLHVVKRWNGSYWQRTTLRDMGLQYHIGHHGLRCHRAAEIECTVIDTNGIHTVDVTFCACSQAVGTDRWRQAMQNGWFPSTWDHPRTFITFECLKRFRTLCVIANINVRDYVSTLERMSDPLCAGFVPDRYKNFGRAVRQWYHIIRMRRTGIAYLPGGVASASLGSAAVKCWACPRPNVNLPEGWEDVQENIRYKYSLFVGLDANFRLENKLRKVADGKVIEVFGDGLGYFAPLDGPDGYIEQLKKHITEEDIKTCSGFQAVMQRDTRFSKGLRATGVAACSCTRHECIRPNGLADMAKGERWATMDFIFACGVQNELMLRIMASYDIGCTWKVYLAKRLRQLPESIGGPEAGTTADIEVSLPVWHAGGHDCMCAACETLRHKVGAGMTDAEGVERIWGVTNPKAASTREMHMDTRHSALEDHFDHHNWSMNLRLRRLLGRRYTIAVEELAAQVSNHQMVSENVSATVKKGWMDMIRAWHEQEKILLKDKTVPNPYLSAWRKEDLTEKQIREELAAQEKAELDELNEATGSKKSSVLGFVTLMLQVEKIQLKIKSLLVAKGKAAYGADQKIADARKSFWPKLKQMRNQQASHMPLVPAILEAEESVAAAESAKKGTSRIPTLPEHVKLWLPSEIPRESRSLYKASLFTVEERLRRLQCAENMDAVRLRLYTKAHIIHFRNKNVVAQKKGTRAKTLLEETDARLASAVRKYRAAYRALVSLSSVEAARPWRRLRKCDITTKFMVDYQSQASRRLNTLVNNASRRRVRAPVGHREDDPQDDGGLDDDDESDYDDLGEELEGSDKKGARGGSRRLMSWIWTAQGAPDESEETLIHDAVRLEWSKSFARAERWQEEVVLLEEEMRRTVVSIRWEESQWRQLADACRVDSEIGRGKRAFALRQAADRAWLADACTNDFAPFQISVE